MKKRRTATDGSSGREEKIFQPHPTHLIGALMHAALAMSNVFSREVGISPARMKLMHELAHAGDSGVGISDLALRLSVTPALITRQIAEFEREGIVVRRGDARDARRSYVALSPAGVAMMREFHTRVHQFESAVVEGIAPADLETAVRVLGMIGERMESWRRSGRSRMHKDDRADKK